MATGQSAVQEEMERMKASYERQLAHLHEEKQKALAAFKSDKFSKSLYGQLLAGEMWLPGEFPVTIRAPRPDGGAAEIGSLKVLADQLLWLNQRTFQADQDEVADWLAMPAEAGGMFLQAARRGYAALSSAVAVAQEAAVPLVMR